MLRLFLLLLRDIFSEVVGTEILILIMRGYLGFVGAGRKTC